MRTIPIPLSKLIKFIPSEPDGGVIPGAVLTASNPSIERVNDFSFRLCYSAQSKISERRCVCRVDEELDIIPESNELSNVINEFIEAHPLALLDLPCLVQDGVTFCIRSGRVDAVWERSICHIPDPYDALGPHQLSRFAKCGTVQIASLLVTLELTDCPMLAVVSKDSNRTSGQLFGVNLNDRIQLGPLCQHNEGWLIPWQSKSEGINIIWFTDAEMDDFIKNSVTLTKA